MTGPLGPAVVIERRNPGRYTPLKNALREPPMHKLVLLRHGESTWNRENRFRETQPSE